MPDPATLAAIAAILGGVATVVTSITGLVRVIQKPSRLPRPRPPERRLE